MPEPRAKPADRDSFSSAGAVPGSGSPVAPGSDVLSPALAEGGHYTLAIGEPSADSGEVVALPDGRRVTALTSPTTRRCFAAAVDEVLALRVRGISATVGLMVGDLALPAGTRPPGGCWAIPPSYRAILQDAELAIEEVRVYGEAYARNQGKRRLLDEALKRNVRPEETYRRAGWALFHGGRDEICIASDESLEWGGDVRVAMLTRGAAPLCPLVFAGLKRAIFQGGFRVHSAFYAVADDRMIDRKLQAAAAAVAQLREGRVGVQRDMLFLTSMDQPAIQRCWRPGDLIAPGEQSWPDFVRAVCTHHPQLRPLEPSI